ncbi:HDOD domain-containing protein [Gammaproteobacteria bacterium AB-CW1]|uniref:HDOD domain-containing protein n=1 Tax=Natronospira elongata TaxID=3110268 RepID=A0AAP6JGU1_9GAMM|nr:HDOD domain-containing protein [Gammaproteobacteria bacterium AB-CW1]
MENVFIARQPIFRKNLSLHGYELLFRSGITETAQVNDGDSATSEVIMSTFTVFGLQDLVGDSTAFINLTRRFLVESGPLPLPSDRTVIEILEDVSVDDELLAAVQRLKKQGYTLALDDYNYSRETEPLLELVDIVKLEMPVLLGDGAEDLIKKFRSYDLTVLAEKIEDRPQLEHCRSLGCDLYQGFFLSRPDISSDTTLSTERLAIIELLSKIHDPDAEIPELEAVISRDLSLSYKLLRYINSAYYQRSFEIRSVRQAIMMLGMKELKRWASIVSLCNATDKPEELVKLLLVRAKMAELLANDLSPELADACFMAGLFSGLDALLDRPMEEILTRLPLAEDIKKALIEGVGPTGEILNNVLAYEVADPSGLHLPKLTAEEVRQHYLSALQWQQSQNQMI